MIYFDLIFSSQIPLANPFFISAFFIFLFFSILSIAKIDLDKLQENFQNLPNIYIYLISFLFLSFNSLKILYNWGQDYGEYYVISYLLEKRALYADGIVNIDDDPFLWIYSQTNKGPTYFFFIKLISSLIGWGKAAFPFTLPTENVFTSEVLMRCGAFTVELVGPEFPPEKMFAIPAASMAFIRLTTSPAH